tara:strand:- start:2704 stop:3558 length:855 start_codon:yes stop_codon:yes gene_type:complete
MNDDIEKSFEGVSPNTFNNYKSYYNRLLKLLGTDTVIQNSNSFIIDTLNDHEILPNSIKTFITIIIRIKRNAGVNIDSLISYRNGKLSKEIIQYNDIKNIELNKTLPSYDEIKSYMNNLLNENKFRDYIINYLLINYGVRNLDIDVLITTDKSVTLKRYIAKENYLYVTPRYIIYQRNNYKTSSVYGRKSYKIVNLSFRNSVNFMLGNKKECRLLFGCEDNTYNEKQIGNIVLNSTFNKIGESSYFKILIKHYQLENNIDMIRFLSQSRGTDLNTIFKYYNINE